MLGRSVGNDYLYYRVYKYVQTLSTTMHVDIFEILYFACENQLVKMLYEIFGEVTLNVYILHAKAKHYTELR